MAIIDDIKKMQQQGMREEDIVRNLRDRGYDYGKISDALSQSKIKAAVSDQNINMLSQDSGMSEGYLQQPVTQEMQPSVMEPQQMAAMEAMPGVGQSQTIPEAQMAQMPEPGAEYYQPEYYQPYQSGMNIENVNEIVEQISEEKLQEIKKQMSELSREKRLIQTRIIDIDERLKKIEKIIQSLQIKILEKFSSYGRGIEDIKKEMQLMGDSFSKVLNPLVDKKREEQKTESKKVRKVKENKGFEHYLR